MLFITPDVIHNLWNPLRSPPHLPWAMIKIFKEPQTNGKWSMNYWPPCHNNTENYCLKLQRWGKGIFCYFFSFEKGIFSALKERGSIIHWLFICPFFKILIIAQGRCEKYKLTLKWRLFSHHLCKGPFNYLIS